MFFPNDPRNENSFKVSTLFQLYILNIEDVLEVFENNEQEQIFFVGSKWEEIKNEYLELRYELDYFHQDKILNLKNNRFLEDLVSLESCVMRNDAIKDKIPK